VRLLPKYVLTGGPGAGKSSLLLALERLNYHCAEEVSRQLIVEQVARGSGCLPWKDLSCFADKVLQRMVAQYRQAASRTGITFFDRGIPDIIAYLKVAGLPLKENFPAAVQQCPYNRCVFMLPPWKDIYVNDPERWQTYEEAVALYEALRETYQHFGYTLIDLPRGTLAQRVGYLLKAIAIGTS
jgi:predicted ATPase